MFVVCVVQCMQAYTGPQFAPSPRDVWGGRRRGKGGQKGLEGGGEYPSMVSVRRGDNHLWCQ